MHFLTQVAEVNESASMLTADDFDFLLFSPSATRVIFFTTNDFVMVIERLAALLEYWSMIFARLSFKKSESFP